MSHSAAGSPAAPLSSCNAKRLITSCSAAGYDARGARRKSCDVADLVYITRCPLHSVKKSPSDVPTKDMDEDMFTFSEESDTSYVQLFHQKNDPFKEFTICLRFRSSLSRTYSLFSLATNKTHNELTISYIASEKKLQLYINNRQNTFSNIIFTEWESICMTWRSVNGSAALWKNGNSKILVLRKGSSIDPNHCIIIGQEQASLCSAFDKFQSFVGDIADINMWDKVLTQDDIRTYVLGDDIRGNVINWRALHFTLVGNATINTAPCMKE